jgi:ABC-type lipoprotein export system ATPase subunit
MSFVQIKGIHKSYGNNLILKGIDLNLNQGDHYCLVGASGSGKSTLLYLIGGLDRPSEGDILIDQKNLAKMSDEELADLRNSVIGFVFQYHFLLSSMNCLDNILLPAKLGAIKIKAVKDNVHNLAKSLGVEHCLKRYPYEISGGEQQRINIIRALSLRPKLLLCDEPTGNLDSKNSQIVVDTIKKLAKEFNSTLVMVTHDQRVAASFPLKITIEDGQIVG